MDSSIEENPQELSTSEASNPDIYMTLSHGFPSESSELHYGKTITKFCKHGGKWAIEGKHFKNPVILFEPGSTFKIKEQKEIFGRSLTNVSKNPGSHQHSAWMIPFLIRLKEE